MNRSSRSVSFSPRKKGNLQFQFTDLKKKSAIFWGGLLPIPMTHCLPFFLGKVEDGWEEKSARGGLCIWERWMTCVCVQFVVGCAEPQDCPRPPLVYRRVKKMT